MLLAIAALLISIGELICRGKRAGVVFIRRRGCWFYHPPPPRYTPFGTLLEIYGLVAGIAQCICSIVQYGYCLRHADSPLKASLLPAIFLICIVGSRLSNMRMNANTTDNMGSWENSSRASRAGARAAAPAAAAAATAATAAAAAAAAVWGAAGAAAAGAWGSGAAAARATAAA
ncbi:unnamed protein product [Prunus armeniaca]